MGKQTLKPDIQSKYFFVDSRRLVEDPGYNDRERWGDIQLLASQILAQGVQQPLIVNRRGQDYVVKSGHRRRRALKILEEQGHVIMVPVILERKGNSQEQRVLHLITDNDGLAFTPWERAKVLSRLRNFGWTDKDIAERSGMSIVYVRRLLSLADAPQKLINLVREGRVSATFAMDAIANDAVDELIEKGEKAELITPVQEPELFPKTAEQPGKITKSDLQPQNSWKIFRKWQGKVKEEELEIPPEKAATLKFVRQIMAGELSEEDIINYFR